MKIFITFVVFLAVTQKSNEQEKKPNLPLNERLEILKYQLTKEIERNRKKDAQPRYQDDVASLEKLEYVDLEHQPITPIAENDERKKNGRFHLKQLKTTTETPWTYPRPNISTRKTTKLPKTSKKPVEIVADDLTSSSEEHVPQLKGIDKILNLPKRNKTVKSLRDTKLHPEKEHAPLNLPSNIFYRRIFDGDILKKLCTKSSIHCIALMTPILTGLRTNITEKKIITYKDPDVMRLLQLLSEDTSQFTVQDIYTHIYQISNVQIRLFQWDVTSLKMLFNVITKATTKRHTWKNIHNGLKYMLGSWHMDLSNVTGLLSQTRVFRPPCIVNRHSGSTRSSKIFRYTKTTKRGSKKCPKGSSDSCELGMDIA